MTDGEGDELLIRLPMRDPAEHGGLSDVEPAEGNAASHDGDVAQGVELRRSSRLRRPFMVEVLYVIKISGRSECDVCSGLCIYVNFML